MSEESKTNVEDLNLQDREQVTATLASTEGLEFVDLKPGDDVSVEFGGNKEHPTVRFQDRELVLDDAALFSAAACVGIQRSYVKKCPADLLFPHLNFWYEDGMKQPIRAIVRDGSLLRTTVDRVKSRPVSNERLLSVAEECIGKDNIVGYHQVSSNLEYSTVAIVTNKSFEPVNADTLFGGVKIQNSILGKETVEVSPYVFRQWCTNGAISQDSLGTYTRKRSNDNLNEWMHDIIGDASSALDHEFERIRHLTTISVKGHLSEILKGIGRDNHIPGRVLDDIYDEATSKNAQTMYDVWNAITRIASHSESLTPIAASRLQEVAGCVSKKNELCPNCHRVVS